MGIVVDLRRGRCAGDGRQVMWEGLDGEPEAGARPKGWQDQQASRTRGGGDGSGGSRGTLISARSGGNRDELTHLTQRFAHESVLDLRHTCRHVARWVISVWYS